MRIESAEVSMRSAYSYSEKRERQEHLTVWGSNRPAAAITISPEALEQFANNRSFAAAPSSASPDVRNDGLSADGSVEPAAEMRPEAELSDPDHMKIRLLQAMLEKMTGKPVKFIIPDKAAFGGGGSVRIAVSNGSGFEYRAVETYSEQESVMFRAEASIRTADGAEIRLNLSVAMSRSFSVESGVHVRVGAPVLADPLVVNLQADSASLTERKFAFDLNADGSLELISFVGPGSGFLALDRNGDGAVNDGSELFGALSGDGFADLRAFDGDGNGWIDEADAVFAQLRIWMQDEAGNDRLLAIGAAGIGAVYLGHVDTPFQYKGAQQSTLGVLRKTGLYVTDKGGAGTIQHIDLAL